MKPFIYFLTDPLEPEHKRYIGLTNCNENRPFAHKNEALCKTKKFTHKINWILKLLAAGRMYATTIIEEFPEDTPVELVSEKEKFYIAEARLEGHKLTNGTEGGEGSWKYTDEIRKKIGDSSKGNLHALGNKMSDETRQQMSESAKKSWTQERRESFGIYQTMRTDRIPVEQRLKIAQDRANRLKQKVEALQIISSRGIPETRSEQAKRRKISAPLRLARKQELLDTAQKQALLALKREQNAYLILKNQWL